MMMLEVSIHAEAKQAELDAGAWYVVWSVSWLQQARVDVLALKLLIV